MNAETEMAGADGLGTNPDPLAELRQACGYSPNTACELDSLIDYKDALEERCRSLEDARRAIEQIAVDLPTLEEWRSAADFMGDAAETLDAYGIERPEHYAD
jgi:hypothetical protein